MTREERTALEYLTVLAERALRYLCVITTGVLAVLIYKIITNT